MSGPRQMITGFNHNIRHNGKIYHVQTEDSGLGNPQIITHLFLGGNILASKKTSYTDIVGAENLAHLVRELMEEQHKEVLRNLVNGVYDVTGSASSAQTRPLQPGQSRPGTSVTLQPGNPAVTGPPPLPTAKAGRRGAPAVTAKVTEALFGEDLISEKSLDEVILSYLAEDAGVKK